MRPEADPTVERASRRDLETVLECWLDLAAEQRAHDSAVRVEANRDRMRQILAAHAADGGLIVARVDDAVVGFVSVTVERGSLALETERGLLSNLYVVPGHRNRGIGTALLRAAEAELESRGAEVVTLEAMARNEAARRFYRRNGYEPYRVAMSRSLEDPPRSDTHSREDG